MRALVTGGGGFLGGAIVRQLLARGVSVRSFARSEYPELVAAGVEVLRGDLRDAAAVAAACEGCDVVFHTAAKPPPWGRRSDYESINVEGTRQVLAGCRSARVPALVYTSTPSVVSCLEDIEGGDESLPYGSSWKGADYPRTKALAEQLVLAVNAPGLRTIALRPHLIWGPGDPHFLPRFVAQARAGKLKRIGRGDPTVDTVYVDDAAAAHLAAWDRLREGAAVHGKAYFVTGDERIGLWTMVDRMLDAAGLPPVRGRVPAGVAGFAAALIEGLWRLLRLGGEPRITRFVVQQVTHARWFDIGAARRELGYSPQVSIDEGLARLREGLEAGEETS